MSKNPYLLLVEDNPGDARLTQDLLDDAYGAQDGGPPPLRWVQSADMAMSMLAQEPQCLAVLLDLGLPDSHGLDALHAMARADGELPIIVLTGNDSAPMGLDAVQSGAQDFLVKGSFDAAMLKRSIAFATQRKRAEAALVRRSLHDDLTGLPRRALLMDRLDRVIRQAARTGTSGALLFIDLDGFKQVNDRLGHAAGDAVLRTVAHRLQSQVRNSDTVARLGGDEFVVLLATITDALDALAVGEKLVGVVREGVACENQQVEVSASIGVACIGPTCASAERLLKLADAAMYRAKITGKGRVELIGTP
jgi:diguanylate cyclase (GGDEF)-like protein